ncbi:hypothetical protein FHY52_01850 [Nocardia nova]|uniref:hypothetical protein n=1 Tax=Nocardia nova TaxID=37330 RepID=UPI0025B15491|nr:hypothetical protein [Nocardia nova]MDN2495460.1 hypothetical protein [Nocardia nova]
MHAQLVPPELTSRIPPAAVLTVFALVAGAAAVYAMVISVRRRDPLPVVACLGALVCAFNEPIYDLLGLIVYAGNHPMAFTSFGRSVPWFLVIGYLPWVGLLPYLISRAMHAGVSRTKLHLLAFGSFLSVVVVESIGTSFHAWTYYGVPPLKYLVVAPQMAPVPIVGGFLLFAVADRYTGWRRIATGFIVSTLALPMVFASASWPLYVGLNSDLPTVVNWLLGIAMLGLTAGVVMATTRLAQDIRVARAAGARTGTDESQMESGVTQPVAS